MRSHVLMTITVLGNIWTLFDDLWLDHLIQILIPGVNGVIVTSHPFLVSLCLLWESCHDRKFKYTISFYTWNVDKSNIYTAVLKKKKKKRSLFFSLAGSMFVHCKCLTKTVIFSLKIARNCRNYFLWWWKIMLFSEYSFRSTEWTCHSVFSRYFNSSDRRELMYPSSSTKELKMKWHSTKTGSLFTWPSLVNCQVCNSYFTFNMRNDKKVIIVRYTAVCPKISLIWQALPDVLLLWL